MKFELKRMQWILYFLVFFIQAVCLAQEKTPVQRPMYMVFINKNGEEVKNLPPDYYDRVLTVPYISHGAGNETFFVDNAGKSVKLDYEADEFSEGMAAVWRCKSEALPHFDLCGYIDQTGRLVIPMKYNFCEGFSEGLALVRKGGKAHTFEDGFGERKDIRYGFIDKNGREVIKIGLAYASSFHEGLAAVGCFSRERLPGTERSLYGYIDRTGKIVIDPKFSAAKDFSEELAPVSIVKIENFKGGSHYSYFWGYIDKMGRVIIQSQFSDARGFHEGLAAVKIGDKWGYIDKSGKIVIQPQFSMAYDFYKGIANVEK